MPFYTLLWHNVTLRPTILSRGAAQSPFQGPLWHITPLCEFRVVAIRLFVGIGPSLFTEVRVYRQTAARAPALEMAPGHFLSIPVRGWLKSGVRTRRHPL